MTITGSGFGNDKNAITVWLNNGSNVYQMNVIEANDTSLKVRIPGGLPGHFNVLVKLAGLGYAQVNPLDANAFTYGIFVDSIFPVTGSINGGTVLTITGSNFSPVLLENQVYVGDAENWNCRILTATTTTITCVTPPINPNYTLDQPVVVVGRAMIDSECTAAGACTFTYDNTTYPTVSNPNPPPAYKSGVSITLEGTGLVNNNIQPLVYVGSALATVTASNETSVTFTYPDLVNGTYDVNVYVDGVGYAKPSFSTNNALVVSSISPENGSYVGNTIYLMGNGLVDVGNIYMSFTAASSTGNVPFNYTIRKDNTPSRFGIDFLGCENNKFLTLNYTFKSTNYSFKYTCLTSLTPTLSLLGATSRPYNNATQNIVFNRSSFATVLPDNVYAFPVDNSSVRFGNDIPLTILSTSGNNFTVDGTPLTVGRYAFKFVYSANGFGAITKVLEITSATAPTVSANIESGYRGGALISINGQGLSKFAKLSVAGIPATLVQSASNTSTLVYSVPPLVTALTQSTYNLVSPTTLTGTFYSDTASKASLAFDNMMFTKYASVNSVCYVGLDFGPYQQALVTSVRFYPNIIWKSVISFIKGATIRASNDGSTWDVLTTLDSTVHIGWNIWKPSTPLTQAYRYVVFQHNTTSGCGLA